MKTALVTGAAGEIGVAICRCLIGAGRRVIGLDNRPVIRDVAKRFNDEQFSPFVGDITDSSSIARCFSELVPNESEFEILVNNAGGITSPTLRNTSEEDWDRDIALNLSGAWRCINAVREIMIRNGHGAIVNVASVNGLGIFGHPGYSVAKAGLIHLSKFCAVEFAPYGIRTVAICPGSIKTRGWKARLEDDPEILDRAVNWYPTRSISTPEELAELVAFAACDAPRNLNGAVLSLDGGLSAGLDRVADAFTGTRFFRE